MTGAASTGYDTDAFQALLGAKSTLSPMGHRDSEPQGRGQSLMTDSPMGTVGYGAGGKRLSHMGDPQATGCFLLWTLPS